MPLKIKLKVASEGEQEVSQQVATSAKKGKRSRQILDDDDDSNSDSGPPAKRRSSNATVRETKYNKQKKSGVEFSESEGEEQEDVDVEGSESDRPKLQKHTLNEDEDVADTSSSRSSSPAPAPSRKQPTQKPEKHSKSKANRIESDDDGQSSEDEPPARSRSVEANKPPRRPARHNTGKDSILTATKPLRKPVAGTKNSKDKDQQACSSLSSIPAIPRRSKDALAAVKDTQDMDLLNKDVYNQLFNTSSSSKPIAKNMQNEAKQKEINAKRLAAKSALLKARDSTFDLQLPTDKVLAFESRLRKLHRWYAPSALGFTYHEELRQRQRQRPQP